MLYCSLKVHTVALVLPPNDIEVKYIHKYSYSTCSKVMVGGVFYGCVLWVSDMYLAKNPTQYNKTYQCKAHIHVELLTTPNISSISVLVT